MTELEVKNNLGDFRLELEESEGRNTITINKYLGDAKEVVVPDNIAGIPVTAIGSYAFYEKRNLAKVTLPESLRKIWWQAFSFCTNLSSINLPESLVSVENDVFLCCKKLTEIKIPKGLVDISGDIFRGCNSLKEIIVDEQNPFFISVDGVLFDKKMHSLISYPGGKTGAYIVPDSVNDIGWDAFSGRKGPKAITFPENFLSLGYCGSGVSDCEKLANIIVNKRNTIFSSIDGVLFNKKGTTLITYPRGKKSSKYIVPDSVIFIKTRAFSECKKLSVIIFQDGLKIIDGFAFSHCDGLTTITLPNTLQYIGTCAFGFCPNLKTITLSRNTKMGYKALEDFTGELIYRD